MRIRRLVGIIALTFGLPAATHAGGVLATPPAPIGAMDVLCLVQNLGRRDIEVTAHVRSIDGVVLETDVESVPPGATRVVAISAGSSGLKYCEFEALGATARGFMNYIGEPISVLVPATR